MDTRQIENLLRADCKLSTTFEGVFASDLLPLFCETSVPVAVVMNMDPSTQGGSHWVCIYIENRHGEYFDSYGLHPPLEAFVKFLNRNCTQWTFNDLELQSLDSNVCGHYCIWFLSERARGRSMDEIVAQFSPRDTAKNDAAVRKLVESRFGKIADDVIHGAAAQKRWWGNEVQCCCARV
jgi:hypothetical protein